MKNAYFSKFPLFSAILEKIKHRELDQKIFFINLSTCAERENLELNAATKSCAQPWELRV